MAKARVSLHKIVATPLKGACVCALLIAACFFSGATFAQTLPQIRVAVLKYGTANWELELIKRENLDRAHGFELVLLQRVSPNASLVALQGGAADITVSDWLWAARQQRSGRDFRFFPYSTAVGELLVPPGSDVVDLQDMAGRSLGVAGGAEDKSWLLFQSYAQRQLSWSLGDEVTAKYAAPPLLSGLVENGQLDGVLTYWHYAARLKAKGFRPVLSLDQVLAGLSIPSPVPMLGWVFSGAYADAQPELVNAFIAASYAAKQRLLKEQSPWEELRPLMQAASDDVFQELQTAYRAGVPRAFGSKEIDAIRRVAEIVDETLPRRGFTDESALPEKVFWRRFTLTVNES